MRLPGPSAAAVSANNPSAHTVAMLPMSLCTLRVEQPACRECRLLRRIERMNRLFLVSLCILAAVLAANVLA
jgi:hypothetical protein